MATITTHRRVRIVWLEPDEALADHCKPGDIAIQAASDGWWTRFVGEDGEVEEYDEPYPSRDQAMWAAKAAAEYGL